MHLLNHISLTVEPDSLAAELTPVVAFAPHLELLFSLRVMPLNPPGPVQWHPMLRIEVIAATVEAEEVAPLIMLEHPEPAVAHHSQPALSQPVVVQVVSERPQYTA